MHNWKSDTIIANGITLHYRRSGGEKPSLLLVHGVTSNGLTWRPIAAALEKEFDVIMIDQRGHGFSEAAESGYSFDDQAADIKGLIDALSLQRPHIIAHSGGAAAAAVFAASNPDIPCSLILEDPAWGSGWGSWQGTAAGMKAWFSEITQMSKTELAAYCREQNPGWDDEQVLLWVDSKQQVSPAVIATFDQPEPKWRESISQITCPILLVYGDQDKGAVITQEDVRELDSLWHNGRALQIGGAGHMVHYDQFDEFVAAVKLFLAENSGDLNGS